MKQETLKAHELTISRKVLVQGGQLAMSLARRLVPMGYEALVLDPSSSSDSETGEPSDQGGADLPNISVLRGARLEEFTGFPGRFLVRLWDPVRGAVTAEVGAVVVALDAAKVDPFRAWNLDPSPSVQTLSSVEALLGAKDQDLKRPEGLVPGTCVFLCGIKHVSYSNTLRRTLTSATTLFAQGAKRVILLLDHLKVADEDLERLSREAREAGVLMVKLTGSEPEIRREGDRIRIAYDDEALGGRVSVRADLLVLEEAYRPASGTGELAERLQINTDTAGFFQGDNVYNLPIFTSRTGIFVIGSGKGPVTNREAEEEAQAAALEIYKLLGDGTPRIAEGRVLLDRRKCAICLTCYRQCPHRAISILDRRPYFHPLACRACGICAAECPMDAIQLQRYTDGQVEAQWENASVPGSIVAFCCENSAYEAARLAAFRGFQLPEGFRLIRVPCAGKLDEDYLLSALAAGAQAVMVMACHHESCKSVHGSHLAESRIEHMKEILEEIGLERDRLVFVTLAPGSAFDFIRAVQRITHDLATPQIKGESLKPSEGLPLFAKEGPGEIL